MNNSLFFTIFNLANQNELVDSLMIFAADTLLYLMLICSLIVAIKGGVREKKAFVFFCISFVIMVVIIKTVHLFIHQARPYVTFNLEPLINYRYGDLSFPSRHASISFVLAISFLIYRSRLGYLLLPLAIWVSFSRIYVGVHYPFDIIGGILCSILAIIISKQALKLLKLKFSVK